MAAFHTCKVWEGAYKVFFLGARQAYEHARTIKAQ
jgi:hypothetical protein